MFIKKGYTYILTNKTNRVLYTGSTDNLLKRVDQHRKKIFPGFTAQYNVYKLVYYEVHDSIICAGTREKQIKGGSRKKKIQLIESMNPSWRDLFEEILI